MQGVESFGTEKNFFLRTYSNLKIRKKKKKKPKKAFTEEMLLRMMQLQFNAKFLLTKKKPILVKSLKVTPKKFRHNKKIKKEKKFPAKPNAFKHVLLIF